MDVDTPKADVDSGRSLSPANVELQELGNGGGRTRTLTVEDIRTRRQASISMQVDATAVAKRDLYRRQTMQIMEAYEQEGTDAGFFARRLYNFKAEIPEEKRFRLARAACHMQQALGGRNVCNMDSMRQILLHLFYYGKIRRALYALFAIFQLMLGFFEWHQWCKSNKEICDVTDGCDCSAEAIFFNETFGPGVVICYYGEWKCGHPVLPKDFDYQLKTSTSYEFFGGSNGEEPNFQRVLTPTVSTILDFICLAFYVVDICLKFAVIKRKNGSIREALKLLFKDVIIWIRVISIVLMIVDYIVSWATYDSALTPPRPSDFPYQFTRSLRPIFLISAFPQLRRIFRNLIKASKPVAYVLALIFLFLTFFCILGTALFLSVDEQRWLYFPSYFIGLINLIILLSTANYPDVMMPAYRFNTAYFLFFLIFLLLGLYFLFSLVLAVVYNFYDNQQKEDFRNILVKKRLAVQKAFYDLDMDQDGRIQLSLWMGFMSYLAPLMDQRRCRLLFKALDVDGKGYLNLKDLYHIELAFETFVFKTKKVKKGRSGDKGKSKLRKCRESLKRLVLNKWFRGGIDIVIGINMLITIIFVDFFAQVLLFYRDTGSMREEVKPIDSNDLLIVLAGESYADWNIIGFAFLIFYILEAGIKIFALGVKGYFKIGWNRFDFVLVAISLILELVDCGTDGCDFFGKVAGNYYYNETLDAIIRSNGIQISTAEARFEATAVSFRHIVLLFRTARGLRLLSHIDAFKVVVATFLQLLPSLFGFFLVLFCVYYFFAIIALESLGGRLYVGEPNQLACLHEFNTSMVRPTVYGMVLEVPLSVTIDGTAVNAILTEAADRNLSHCQFEVYPAVGATHIVEASEYHIADYYKNNFNGLVYTIITLFELMVVNNWFITMDGYVRATGSDWTRIYFVAFYVISVIFVINVIVAFVIDAFIMQFEAKRAQDEAEAAGEKIGTIVTEAELWMAEPVVEKGKRYSVKLAKRRGFDVLLEQKLSPEEVKEVQRKADERNTLAQQKSGGRIRLDGTAIDLEVDESDDNEEKTLSLAESDIVSDLFSKKLKTLEGSLKTEQEKSAALSFAIRALMQKERLSNETREELESLLLAQS